MLVEMRVDRARQLVNRRDSPPARVLASSGVTSRPPHTCPGRPLGMARTRPARDAWRRTCSGASNPIV